MLIGHYSVSLAARAAVPAVPLWAFVLAAQLLDILWCLFVMAGIESVSANPAVTEGLTFREYPWSHSLVAAFVWGGIATQVSRHLFKVPARSATLIGVAVVSHWFLDLIVHREDLPLRPGGGPEYGLGLWDRPGLELGLEIVLFVGAGLWLLSVARRRGARAWPLLLFLLAGTALFVAARSMPLPEEVDPVAIGAMGLSLYLGFAVLAWLAERGEPGTKDPA